MHGTPETSKRCRHRSLITGIFLTAFTTAARTDSWLTSHPQSSTATGNNAQLERFLEATRAQLDGDDALTFTYRDALTEDGAVCDGEPAILH